LYALIRMSVHTDREIRRCLWVSVGTACIVAVLAILQSLGLPGLSQILATEYAPVAATGGLLARGSSTLGLPAATADLMLYNLANYFWPQLFSAWNFILGVRAAARIPVASKAAGYVWIESGYTWLLWGGGIPLLASFVFFVLATAKRGWQAARSNAGAASVAGIATFVAIIV